MSLQDSFFGLLSRGSPNVDDNEAVEIAVVPLPSGILVPRHQAVEATAALDELR